MLRNRSLLFKLTAAGFLVIAVLGLLWSCAGWYFLSAASHAAKIRSTADQVFIGMLQVRRAEKNFLLRDLPSSEFYAAEEGSFATEALINHQQRVQMLLTDIARLKALLPEEMKVICDTLAVAVQDYNRDFAKLVAAYRQRGDEDTGFAGQWRSSAAELEALLKAADNSELLAELLELRRREKDYLMRGDPKYAELMNEQLSLLRERLPVELPESAPEALRHLSEFEAAFQGYLALTSEIGRTDQQGLRQELSDAVDTMEPLVIDPETGIKQYGQKVEAVARGNMLVAQFFILILGVLAAVLVYYLIGRSLTAPLARMASAADAIAGGDLTQKSLEEGGDEAGRLSAAFNKMVLSLRSILAQAKSLTGEVATSSSEIATSAQQQLASLGQTATSLNEITATAEEFKATMQEFADRSRAVQEAAKDTAEQTMQGRTLTRDSAARIEQVRSNSQKAGESVLSLSEQMQRIGEITATVNEIAEQTKLLALNASIEAARAGEDGRGFAVVATQVRDLANQSKESAGRIESLISATQKSMRDVVSNIENGNRLAEDSVAGVRQMSEAFDHISDAIGETSEAMSQINLGAKQQEQGIAELVNSITEIDSGSKESLAAAEQTQKALVAIDQRIRMLNQSIARFEI